MKNLESLGRSLSKAEQKRIMGGDGEVQNPDGDCGTANTYCGEGSGVTCCSGRTCQPALNGSNPYVKGGDKLCA